MPFEGGRNWSRPPPAHFPVEDGGQDTRLQRLKSSQNALNSFKQLHYDFSSTYAHRPSRSLNKLHGVDSKALTWFPKEWSEAKQWRCTVAVVTNLNLNMVIPPPSQNPWRPRAFHPPNSDAISPELFGQNKAMYLLACNEKIQNAPLALSAPLPATHWGCSNWCGSGYAKSNVRAAQQAPKDPLKYGCNFQILVKVCQVLSSDFANVCQKVG